MISILLTLSVASIGGAIFSALHVPLAWMIGAMVATATLNWHYPAKLNKLMRPVALVVLGLSLGQSFTPAVVAAIGGAIPAMLVAGMLSILTGVMVAPMLGRMAGLDSKTGYFSSVPGGVVVMIVLAQRAGVSLPPVTIAQTIRVLVVVLTFPLGLSFFAHHAEDSVFNTARLAVDLPWMLAVLAGGLAVALGMSRTRIANPWMLPPLILSIALTGTGHMPSGIPGIMVNMAQIVMGASLGQRITREFILSSRRLMIAAVLSSLILCVICAVIGVGLGLLFDLPPPGVVLGMAPGGMPEMGITARSLDLAVPLVLGFHLTRTLLCNLFVGPIYDLARRLRILR
ncbi:AbrB family transcriptional regulator [Rhodovarius crocodyli]|uniref:AbrB family transcriptional regulator n=1 Tax=Rhodovarius crocodyli TaxID=1979269 RepID=UPI0013E2EA21|nr:AbrB family transcriptional regulator [Rhodovarius crocodyli]